MRNLLIDAPIVILMAHEPLDRYAGGQRLFGWSVLVAEPEQPCRVSSILVELCAQSVDRNGMPGWPLAADRAWVVGRLVEPHSDAEAVDVPALAAEVPSYVVSRFVSARDPEGMGLSARRQSRSMAAQITTPARASSWPPSRSPAA